MTTHTQETPMDTFRRIGITPGRWTQEPGRSFEFNELPCWEITLKRLTTPALRDIAFLIAEGWSISISPSPARTITIRIKPNRLATANQNGENE